MVSFMLLMTNFVTFDGEAAYDTIDVFGSGEDEIDLNFTDWEGGFDNTSISVKMPKWSSAIDAKMDITGTEYIGPTSTMSIDNATEWGKGTQNTEGYLTHDRWGFHLDPNGAGLFGTPVTRTIAFPNTSNMTSVDAGNIFDNGRNETVISNYGADNIMVASRSGGGYATYYYGTSDGPVVSKIGNLNIGNDTSLDIAVGTEGGQEVLVLLRRVGSVWFDKNHTLSVGAAVRDLIIADVTNDSRDDIVVAAGDSNGMVFMQEANGTFTKVVEMNLSSGGLPNCTYRIRGCAVADLNGDDLNDTAWTLSTDNGTGYFQKYGIVKICYQNSSHNITTVGSKLRYAYTAAWGIDAGDVNNDGWDDIVVTNKGSSENLHVLYQDQHGNISVSKGVPCKVIKQGWPAIGDLNGDGINDVAVGGGDKNLSVLLQRNSIINGTVWNKTTPNPINMVCVADTLNDGLPDLVTANTIGKSWSVYDQEDRFYGTWNSGPLDQPVAIKDVVVRFAIDSGGSTTRIYFSWDNSSWQYVTNGFQFNSTSRPTMFWLRLTTSSNVFGDLDVIRYISADMTPSSYPSEVALDVGVDGTVDWNMSGELFYNTEALRLEEAITAYLQDPDNTPDGEGMVAVPIGIRTAMAGNLRVSNLNIVYNIASTKPELEYPEDGSITDATPNFQWEADDSNGDKILYLLQLTKTDFDDAANTTIFDMRQSRYNEVLDEGFSAGQYVSGATASFVLPARFDLEDGATYKWRVMGYDLHILGVPSDTRNFTVDALAPETRMTSPEYSTELGFSVNWTAMDPSPGSGLRASDTFDVQYRRSTDSHWTDWLTGTTELRATFQGEEGTIYHFRMRAWDDVDNTGPFTGGDGDTTTRVDTLDPILFINSPLEGEIVTDHSLELLVDARDGAFTLSDGMVLYKMADRPWNPMNRSFSDPGVWEVTLLTDNMDEGDHTVFFRATDDVGHMVQMSRDFVIDNNDPICILEAPIEDAMTMGTFLVQVDAQDALGVDRVEVQVRGLSSVMNENAMYNPTSGYWDVILNTSGLEEGSIQLSALAWDTSGLSSGKTPLVSIRVDNTPPRLEITEPTDGTHIEGTMKLVHVKITDLYFDTSVDVVRVSFDGGGWTDMAFDRVQFTILWDMTSLPDGEHTISATATDAAGHTTEVTAIVHIDNTAPVITFVSPVEGHVLSGQVTLDALLEEIYLDKAQADVDGPPWTDIIEKEFVIDTREYLDGSHTITVWAMDIIGHVTEISIVVVFDNTPPVLTPIDVPVQGGHVAGEVPFILAIKDANVHGNITVEVDGTVVSPSHVVDGGNLMWTFPSDAYADGEHAITITVVDVASNTAILNWTGVVDNAPPTVYVRSPGDRANGAVRFVVEVTDVSGVTSVQLRLGDGDWMVMVHEAEGVYVHEWSTDSGDNQDLHYTVRASDSLGNTGETDRKVEISNFNVITALVLLAMVAMAVIVAAFIYLRRGGSGERT